jgi:hypothetical protein
MKKDYGAYSILLCGLILIFLIAISSIPPFKNEYLAFKKSDILKDIRVKDKLIVHVIPHPKPPKRKNFRTPNAKKEIAIPDGVTEIEDFSDNGQYLGPFFQKVDSINTIGRPVRIGFFGDSFTECGVLTADLRQQLQEKWWGTGGGFVPLRLESAGPSPLADIQQENFTGYSIITKKGKKEFHGTAGRYFLGHNNASFSMTLKPYRPYTKKATTAYLYFTPLHPLKLITTRGKMSDTVTYEASKSIKVKQLKGDVSHLSFMFTSTDSVIVYGVGYDSEKGIGLDNLSIRGNSGISLNNIPTRKLKEFNGLRPYDLIILEYGLNAFSAEGNYNWYKKQMIAVVNRIKSSFPEAQIILMGMSDKGEMKEGEVVTCERLPEFIEAQREIASETGICFWNTFQAMGGEGTMARWAEGEHPLAAKDFTHIGIGAGRFIAKKLVASMLLEQEKYKK